MQPRPFLDDVMQRLRRISDEVVAEMANSSEMARRIHESYSAYKARVEDWHAIAEHAYLNARAEQIPSDARPGRWLFALLLLVGCDDRRAAEPASAGIASVAPMAIE